MQEIDNLINAIFNINIWSVVKLAYLLASLIYIIFATVIVKQVSLMTRALKETLNPVLRLFAWIHLGLAILVFLIALFIL